MDLLIIVLIKSSYDSWKAVFDSDPGNRKDFADETRTRVGKVDNSIAMVQLFDVDMLKMSQMVYNPSTPVADIMAEHIVKREIYKVEEMSPPSA